MRFVALDLETTWLDPNTDTIIEVAAIVFSVMKTELDIVVNIEDKRTMLINPDREISEEVTIITNITNEMVNEKQKWAEVRDRVVDFIGEDSIIVGHNVLFDIAMFQTHGIDLQEHTVIDTFELAELFSQEFESLNLGFLANKYNLSAGEAEHRALGDTRLSIGLFEKYLNIANWLPEKKKSILRLMAKKETTPSVSIFCDIVGIGDWEVFHPEWEWTPSTPLRGEKNDVAPKGKKASYYSIDGNREVEVDLLLSVWEKYGKVLLLAPNKKVQSFLLKTLQSRGAKPEILMESSRFCSLEEVSAMIVSEKNWERKVCIFMGKLLFWLEDTKTGIIDELKFYSEERELIRWFRKGDDEFSSFQSDYNDKLKWASHIVADMQSFLRNPDSIEANCVVIKDIPLFEDMVRKNQSVHISIEELTRDIRSFGDIKNFLYTLYLLIDLYMSVPERPKWENPIAPWSFGETYFFTQSELWEKKEKWLVLFTRLLWEYYTEWKNRRVINTRRERIQAASIDKQIEMLLQYGLSSHENIGTILHIREEGTHLHFIPRNTKYASIQTTMNLPGTMLIPYGYNIEWVYMKRFLREECGIIEPISPYIPTEKTRKHLTLANEKTTFSPGSVILVTSQKQIREIGKMLGQTYTDTPILMQWLSGWKGKILSLYLENPENSILIGLIDSWRDEFILWENTKSIHIIKLPFDPPSDPYFLARTVGMSDNFAHYSQPMAIIRINTLIGRIRSAGYRWTIYCHDERLEKTIWWQEIAREIL